MMQQSQLLHLNEDYQVMMECYCQFLANMALIHIELMRDYPYGF